MPGFGATSVGYLPRSAAPWRCVVEFPAPCGPRRPHRRVTTQRGGKEGRSRGRATAPGAPGAPRVRCANWSFRGTRNRSMLRRTIPISPTTNPCHRQLTGHWERCGAVSRRGHEPPTGRPPTDLCCSVPAVRSPVVERRASTIPRRQRFMRQYKEGADRQRLAGRRVPGHRQRDPTRLARGRGGGRLAAVESRPVFGGSSRESMSHLVGGGRMPHELIFEGRPRCTRDAVTARTMQSAFQSPSRRRGGTPWHQKTPSRR